MRPSTLRLRRPALAWFALLGLACSPESAPPAPERASETHRERPPRSALVGYAAGPERNGYLHLPEGEGPFPVVVYNHGSERNPPDFSGQAAFYLPRGYAVFAPHRRGHGRSASEVAYPADVLDTLEGDPARLVSLVEAQFEDVLAAISYLRTRDDIDASRVTVAGCSLGGMQALLAAERADLVHRVVSFSPGAIVWSSNAPMRARLHAAVTRAHVPVLLLQAENDFNTAPTTELSAAMRAEGLPVRSRIFPPNGVGARAGHAFCGGGASPAWGDEVMSFLEAPAR